jgi:hypothetical protein
MSSAARTLVEGGVAASTITLPRVAAAAEDIWCKREIDWPKAARRASASGMMRYSAPSGLHDDVVISLGIAWAALGEARSPRRSIRRSRGRAWRRT